MIHIEPPMRCSILQKQLEANAAQKKVSVNQIKGQPEKLQLHTFPLVHTWAADLF